METGRKVNIPNAAVFEFLPPSPDGAKTFDLTITSRQKIELPGQPEACTDYVWQKSVEIFLAAASWFLLPCNLSWFLKFN